MKNIGKLLGTVGNRCGNYSETHRNCGTVNFTVEIGGWGASITKLMVPTIPMRFSIVPTTVSNGPYAFFNKLRRASAVAVASDAVRWA